MNPILREYLLKGLFLGMWAYLALVLPPNEPDWTRFGRIVGFAVGGLIVGLIAGAAIQIRRGYRPFDNWKAFPLVVLLESPFPIYLGVVAGLALGVVIEFNVDSTQAISGWLGYFVAGGLLLGYGFQQLRQINDWFWRFGIALFLGAALVYLALSYLDLLESLAAPIARRNFAIAVLIGLPFFYLLSFCGEAEESEVEIAAICACMGIGLYAFGLESGSDLFLGKIVFLLPIAIYFVYATRVLPGLRVFKHTLRGYSALNVNRPYEALVAFKRALRLQPNNTLATNGMWQLHQSIDVSGLAADSPILRELDYEFCLNQANSLLLGARTPNETDREKAERLLRLVEQHRPAYLPRIGYLRAVLQTHAKQFDAAADHLKVVLDPAATTGETTVRESILVPAWQLALRWHPEMTARLGETSLALPGRRMEAIRAIETQLSATPQDDDLLALRDTVYPTLLEEEFLSDAASGLPTAFNYDYAEQLGLSLLEQETAIQRERGMSFLRIAARGLPARGIVLFQRLAESADTANDPAAALGYREQIKRIGVQIGQKALPSEQREIYLKTLEHLATEAEARGDIDSAIGDRRLQLEAGQNEVESIRKLADLYEKNKDALNALLMTETGLVYLAKDRDFLARKDRYYYSVDLEKLQSVKEKVRPYYDVDYCTRKAKQILDQKETDLESLDWALHLVRSARILNPTGIALQLSEARIRLRKGENEASLSLLEDAREQKPSGSEESEAWYQVQKLLGEMYLNDHQRPDLAVQCFLAYRDYSKSGADTLFQIARSYEGMEQPQSAIKFYEQVTAYDQHPRYWDAREAINRLKGA